MPPGDIELRDDRYLTGGACLLWSCKYRKSGCLVDTLTEHTAIAFVRSHDVNGKSLPFNFGLAIFTKACASPEFKAYARRYFTEWSRREDEPGEPAVTTLTTRC